MAKRKFTKADKLCIIQEAVSNGVQETLQQNGVLPSRGFASLKELQQALNEYDELLIDATELRRQHTDNPHDKKEDYSDKKSANDKMHGHLHPGTAHLVLKSTLLWKYARLRYDEGGIRPQTGRLVYG